MEKEKILYITAYVPHKAAAGEKNTMLMLNDLSEKYDIDLIYFKYNFDAPYKPKRQNINVIEIFRNSKLLKIWGITNFPFIHPVFSIRFSWFKLLKIKKHIKSNQYKVIILNHSNVFYYGKFMPNNTPKLLLAHDVIIQRAQRSSNWIMQKICHYSENMCFRLKNSHIFSFSQKDVDIINKEYSLQAKVCLDYIDPDIINKQTKCIQNYFMMFGDWTRKENYEGAVWFIEKVSPLLKKETYIKIVGRKFPTDKIYNTNPLVHYEVMGFIDDPYKLLSESKALLSPLFHGAGIKVKVVESLACGTPVIGSDIAFEGISDIYSQFMIKADTPEEYANVINNLSITIEERKKYKQMFLENYIGQSIVTYIENL